MRGYSITPNHIVEHAYFSLLHLRRKVESQKEGQLSFLKANVGSVMDQVDTLVTLKDKFLQDAKDFGPEPTLKLEKSIKGTLFMIFVVMDTQRFTFAESEREARKLFDDVLSRRDRAEKTRNALNVLARFRFLFCLPCVIDKNIKKGDYDIVINDYMRVKNLFNNTEIPVGFFCTYLVITVTCKRISRFSRLH